MTEELWGDNGWWANSDVVSLDFHVRTIEWTVREEIWFTYEGETLICPVGMKTDLSSIPQFLRSRFPVVDHHILVAIGHDRLYRQGMWTRKIADEFFYDGCIASGMGTWNSKMMWTGLRSFGGMNYKG